MPFDKHTGSECATLGNMIKAKRRGLETGVIKAATNWVAYIKSYQDNQSSWQSIHQIRLCEAVEALNEFVKYG